MRHLDFPPNKKDGEPPTLDKVSIYALRLNEKPSIQFATSDSTPSRKKYNKSCPECDRNNSRNDWRTVGW
jgi:hypothetical protein